MSNSRQPVMPELQKFMIGGERSDEASAVQAREILEAKADRVAAMTAILSTIPTAVFHYDSLKPKFIINLLPRLNFGDTNDPYTLFIGSKVWDVIKDSPEFVNIIDPETRHARINAGYLGVMYGMAMITNAYDGLGTTDALTNTIFLATMVNEKPYVAKLIFGGPDA